MLSADRVAVHAEDHVTRLQTGLRRGAVGRNAAHQRAFRTVQSDGLRDRRRHFLDRDTKIRAGHVSIVHDLVHDGSGEVDGHRETDSLIAARSFGENGGVDADQFAAVVHERAAGVAGIDRRVGLDEVFIVFDAEAGSPRGADDAHRHGLADAIGVADGEHDVADLQLVGVADGDGGEIGRVDFDDARCRSWRRCR